MLDTVQKPYAPNQVVAAAEENHTQGHPELLEGRPTLGGQATAYVCQNFTCQKPVTTIEELIAHKEKAPKILGAFSE